MPPRSLVPLVLLALLCVTSAAQAAVRIDCKPAASGPCVQPPAPPPPPAPPAPPSLPGMPPGIAPPAPPAPVPPAIPAPPPPPALPAIPDQAHAACAAKANGSTLSLRLGPNETMSGLCERVDGKMVFRLRSYRLDD